MPFATSPVIGTIRIEPLPSRVADVPADDATLALALGSFARRNSLADSRLSLVASTRLAARREPIASGTRIRADLAQLLVDLQAEFAELSQRLA
jgi:hypothetical protein